MIKQLNRKADQHPRHSSHRCEQTTTQHENEDARRVSHFFGEQTVKVHSDGGGTCSHRPVDRTHQRT